MPRFPTIEVHSSGQVVAARELFAQFLQFTHVLLRSQGDWEEISKAVEMVEQEGTGASRQRKIYAQTGSLQQVVAFIIKETARGTG